MITQILSSEQIEEYVAKILASRQRSVADIVEQGRLLGELRKATSHGQWNPLFGRDGPLRMSVQMAYDLIKIARHEILSNPEHALDLPMSWFVLFQLSHIPAARLEKLIADGSVHCGLQRKAADILVQREIGRGRETLRGLTKKGTSPPR